MLIHAYHGDVQPIKIHNRLITPNKIIIHNLPDTKIGSNHSPRFQVLGANRINTGNISSLPTNISKISTHFEK